MVERSDEELDLAVFEAAAEHLGDLRQHGLFGVVGLVHDAFDDLGSLLVELGDAREDLLLAKGQTVPFIELFCLAERYLAQGGGTLVNQIEILRIEQHETRIEVLLSQRNQGINDSFVHLLLETVLRSLQHKAHSPPLWLHCLFG